MTPTLSSRKHGRLKLALLLSTTVGLGHANSQTAAVATLDHAEVSSGEIVKLLLTLDQAPTCGAIAIVSMVDARTSKGFSLVGNAVVGQKSISLSEAVPKDISGSFQGKSMKLYPCEGYSVYRDLPISQVTLNVTAVSDPNNYPSVANATLQLTQKQFLDTQAAELRSLSGQIDQRVEEGGRDSRELRSFLTRVVEDAEAALVRTERGYKSQILKTSEALPPFFADFRRQYEHLHVELRAPIPGTSAFLGPPVHLVYVQQPLQRRSPTQGLQRSGNNSGTSPVIATAVKQAVNDNASAYRIVSSTGTPKFHIEFSSRPQGASIYYRQAILEDFMLWSSVTDTTGAEFDLATFVFKFHKDGCRDEPVRTIDPYYDTHPVISVEFRGCSIR